MKTCHSQSYTALCCAGLFGLVSPTLSQAAEPASAQDEIEIVITAGRKAQTVDDTLAPVSIITRQDIEASQASSVPEVLKTVPGLSLTSNGGGLGKLSSVHLRGTSDKHVLVLVDGVRVGSATLGSTAFEYLPLDQVERIEIVRGPRSSLYGSEAIGGVIQIFTRKGSGREGIRPEASISYGSHNTRKADANISGGSGDGSWFNLGVATVRTDGINVLESYTKYLPNYATVQVKEPDKDGYTNNNVSLRAGHRFDNGLNAEFNALHAEGENEFDGASENNADFVQQVLSGKLSLPVSSIMTVSAQLGQSNDEQDSYKDDVFSSRFHTKRTNASLQADARLGGMGLTLGLDHQQDKIDSNSTYSVTSRSNKGVFANAQARVGENKLDVSVRHDDNQQFGNKTTGGIALAHEFAGG